MKKDEPLQTIKDTTLKYKKIVLESDVICKICLEDQMKKKIDEKRYSKMLSVQTIRDFSCQTTKDLSFPHSKTVTEREEIICLDCQTVCRNQKQMTKVIIYLIR